MSQKIINQHTPDIQEKKEKEEQTDGFLGKIMKKIFFCKKSKK
jgi:hypothetical protein